MNRPACYRCNGQAVLRRNTTSNGYPQVGWFCIPCNRWAVKGQPFIARTEAEAIAGRWKKTLNDIPQIGSNSEDVCIICGSPQTEIHHFAPQEFAGQFDEWAKWPTAALCPFHHTQWHEIVQGRKIR